MHVEFHCPVCSEHQVTEVNLAEDGPAEGKTPRETGEASTATEATPERAAAVTCPKCDWSGPPARQTDSGSLARCGICGCDDLWRQKDFPQSIGLLLVAVGAILSTIAWAYHEPLWSIGTLLGFAALDLLLFALVADVLVCYRCGARYRGVARESDPAYDHELGERYRQEAIRLENEQRTSG